MTSAVRKPTPPLTETGYAQAPAHNWWQYQDETTPELMWPQSISVYDAMRRTDSQVKSVLQAMTLPVRSTPWRVDPDGATDEVSEFVADNLGLPVVGMEPKSPLRQQDRFSWDDHIRLALLMLPFGHMFFEQIYRVDPDGKARIRKMGPRMPKTIEKIDVAEDGGLISITQYWTRTDRRPQPIPVNRLVAYVNEREGGNWLGNSILRPAYKNWLLKDRLLRVWAQTIERNGMGIPLYKGPEDATDLSTGLAMAKAWRAGEAAGSAVPFGADLTLVGVSGTLPDADPAVRYHDEQIGRAVLAHFLNLGTQTGSWALGTTFADFFTLSLQSLAMQIADTTTRHVVEDLVDINFGPDEPAPRVVFDEIGSRQPATAQSLVALFGAGALTPDARLEESLRQQYGLPPRQNEVDTGTDQPLIEEPAEGPIEVTARASYPGQKWRHGWKRIGDALMPKRGTAPSTAGPDSDRPPSMSDLAHELDGLHGGGKRKHLLDLGYDADEVYALLGDDDMPKSMSDLAYELRGLSPGDKVNVLLAWGYLPDEIPDLLGMGRSVRAAGQAILDRIDGRDTVEPGQFDAVEVDAAALVAALADFCGEIWAEADFNPDLHPRGAGGRFRSTFARIQRALTDWGNGDGPDDPLHAFPDREPLRQAAVKRGVKLRRGATRDEIVDALLADARGKRAGTEDVPKPRASFTLKGGAGPKTKAARDLAEGDMVPSLDSADDEPRRVTSVSKAAGGDVVVHYKDPRSKAWNDHGAIRLPGDMELDLAGAKGDPKLRDLDVGVYVEAKPNSKIFLRREKDGRPGTILESFDDLDAMAAWAEEHGETELAGWAVKERDGSKPVKKAAKKAAPKVPDTSGDSLDFMLALPSPTKAKARQDHVDGEPLSVKFVEPGDEVQDANGDWTRVSRVRIADRAYVLAQDADGNELFRVNDYRSVPVRIKKAAPSKAPVKRVPARAPRAKWEASKSPAAGVNTHSTSKGHVTEFLPDKRGDKRSYRAYRGTKGGAADFESLAEAKSWVEAWDGESLGEAQYGAPTDVGGDPVKRVPGKKAAPKKAGSAFERSARAKRVVGRDLKTEVAQSADRIFRDESQLDRTRRQKAGDLSDTELQAIGRMQGFDAPPVVATEQQVDAAVANGWVEMWRGSSTAGGLPPAAIAERFRTGDYAPGFGEFGNGYYATVSRDNALVYTAPTQFPPFAVDESGLQRMALSPDARVLEVDDPAAALRAAQEAAGLDPADRSAAGRLLSDLGHLAAAQGYDALVVRGQPDGAGGEPVDQYVVLNRSAVMVQAGTPAQTLAAIEAAADRDEARRILGNASQADLDALAKAHGGMLYLPSVARTLAERREEAINAIVGRKMDSEATRYAGLSPEGILQVADRGSLVAMLNDPGQLRRLGLTRQRVQRRIDEGDALPRGEGGILPAVSLADLGAAPRKPAIPPAEQAARDRQVKVDRASSVHDLVSEVDQLLTDGASDRALKARITSRAKVSNTPPAVRDRLLAAVGDVPAMRQVLADIRREEGLTPIGEAGGGARFDPNLHESIGGDIPLGAPVTVVRPGHRLDAEDVTFPARVEAGEPLGRPSAPSVPTKATPARKAAKKAAPKVATSDVSTALIDAGDDTSAISSALSSLNSSQLKDLARQYGITGGSRMNRAQLVAALTEAVRRRNLASGVGETIAESAAKARGGA